jgi:hypothetical protein
MAKAYKKTVLESLKDKIDIERQLIIRIGEAGRSEVRRRKKKGLSSFFVRNGRIIEKLPDNTEQTREAVHSKWITVAPGRRIFKFK